MKSIERFSDRANDYALGRPSYPDEAIEEIFEGLSDPKRLTVADLGAGTGISSRLLALRGASVIAVEPNVAMRESALPAQGVVWRAGSAENPGLGDASADLVTAFQAFHWFDHAAALGEIDRIVRPGGRIALIYNERDDDDPFTAAYSAIVRAYTIEAASAPPLDAGSDILSGFPTWGRLRLKTFRNAHVLNRVGLLARARSVSYLPQAGDAYNALETKLEALFDTFCVDQLVTMHLTTTVTIGGPKA